MLIIRNLWNARMKIFLKNKKMTDSSTKLHEKNTGTKRNKSQRMAADAAIMR